MKKLLQIAEENAATLQSISTQYNEKMKKLQEFQNRITEASKQLDTAVKKGLNAAAERLNNKLQVYQEQFDTYKKAAQTWLETQKKAADSAMSTSIDSINKRIEKEAERLVTEITKSTTRRKENKKKTV